MTPADKKLRHRRRTILRKIVENYLTTASPMRLHQTAAQIKAAAKQMVQANRIPLPVAKAIMSEIHGAEAQSAVR